MTPFQPTNGQPPPLDQPDKGKPIPAPSPRASQLKLSDSEEKLLLSRMTQDYDAAISDYNKRIELNRRHYKAWRSKIGLAGGETGKSNFRVPLIVWQVLTKLAKTIDAILGDDAEVIAQPTGPTDQAVQQKVSRYMTWLLFNKMDIVEPLAVFIFHVIMFGRAHALCDWVIEEFESDGKMQDWYEGPRFVPILPGNLVHPPMDEARSPQDFPWVCRRYFETPDELLQGEEDGKYYGISDDPETFRKIVQAAKQGLTTDSNAGAVKQAMREDEGVVSDYGASCREVLEIREDYRRWRLLKNLKSGDASEDNFTEREMRETDVVIRYIPAINKIISFQRLDKVYPLTRNRRPIVSASLLKDGSYYSPGFPEMLLEVEKEMTVVHNQVTEAVNFTIMPPIFARPSSGLSPENTKYENGYIYWTEDPDGVKQMQVRADFNGSTLLSQMLLAISERLTGLTDQNTGRSSDRPNAPRTYRGQALLLGQGDLRNALDTILMGEDWSKILDHIKMLVDTFAPAEEEFRVTEESASGYFESHKGFATITAEERSGKYDFKLKFATSQQSREARKERMLAFLQAGSALPIFLQNPNLQKQTLIQVAKELQLDGLIPALNAVADANVPETPQQEWTEALQGIDPQIHPQDDDTTHIQDHMQRIADELQKPEERQDKDAIHRMIAHVMLHKQQQEQKLQIQAAASAQAAMAGLAGGLLGQTMAGDEQSQNGQQQGASGNPAALLGLQSILTDTGQQPGPTDTMGMAQ